MKEYKVGDTIYVKGKVKQVDESDDRYPYGVTFNNRDYADAWVNDQVIVKPVKPVLPKEVGEELDIAKVEFPFDVYIGNVIDGVNSANASYHYYSDNTDAIIKLADAWRYGYTVEKESRYMVYVPGTNKKFVYNKRGDSSNRAAKLETPIVPSPVTSYQTTYGQYKPLYWFTDEEITKFNLQDCEKEEIK